MISEMIEFMWRHLLLVLKHTVQFCTCTFWVVDHFYGFFIESFKAIQHKACLLNKQTRLGRGLCSKYKYVCTYASTNLVVATQFLAYFFNFTVILFILYVFISKLKLLPSWLHCLYWLSEFGFFWNWFCHAKIMTSVATVVSCFHRDIC